MSDPNAVAKYICSQMKTSKASKTSNTSTQRSSQSRAKRSHRESKECKHSVQPNPKPNPDSGKPVSGDTNIHAAEKPGMAYYFKATTEHLEARMKNLAELAEGGLLALKKQVKAKTAFGDHVANDSSLPEHAEGT